MTNVNIQKVEQGNIIEFTYGYKHPKAVAVRVSSIYESRYNPAMVVISGLYLEGVFAGQWCDIPYEKDESVNVR